MFQATQKLTANIRSTLSWELPSPHEVVASTHSCFCFMTLGPDGHSRYFNGGHLARA